MTLIQAALLPLYTPCSALGGSGQSGSASDGPLKVRVNGAAAKEMPHASTGMTENFFYDFFPTLWRFLVAHLPDLWHFLQPTQVVQVGKPTL
jgi:hypothetical protein